MRVRERKADEARQKNRREEEREKRMDNDEKFVTRIEMGKIWDGLISGKISLQHIEYVLRYTYWIRWIHIELNTSWIVNQLNVDIVMHMNLHSLNSSLEYFASFNFSSSSNRHSVVRFGPKIVWMLEKSVLEDRECNLHKSSHCDWIRLKCVQIWKQLSVTTV